MKKKIAKVLVAGLIGLQLIGCSNQSTKNTEENQNAIVENTEAATIYFKDINPQEYVTLGEYKGIEVVSNQPVVSDEEVEDYIDYLLSMSA